MQIEDFIRTVGVDFFAGVPDSQLKALGNYLMDTYGQDVRHHVVAANEGNAVGLAAGYHMATGKVPIVYMQNSGQGNAVNPITSLLHEEVYGIPVIFVIGWRGEPGVHDEPQHIFQGKITLSLLDQLQIPYEVIGAETSVSDIEKAMTSFYKALDVGKSVAFVVRKGGFEFSKTMDYANGNSLTREAVIERLCLHTGDDPIISTTGKPSRELFEIREARAEDHSRDFLSVGSMGHASSIALEIAAQKPKKRIWCLDGDGAALMHMGAMATIGASGIENLVHVVLNNGSHETVGGIPTVVRKIDLPKIAEACGYASACEVATYEAIDDALENAKTSEGPHFIVILCEIGSRKDLGRPTISPKEAKANFMNALNKVS